MKYELKTHSIIVKPAGEPIFSEQATIVGIDDEGGGVYYTLEQHGGVYYTLEQHGGNVERKKVSFDAIEWLLISEAVERLRGEWTE